MFLLCPSHNTTQCGIVVKKSFLSRFINYIVNVITIINIEVSTVYRYFIIFTIFFKPSQSVDSQVVVKNIYNFIEP